MKRPENAIKLCNQKCNDLSRNFVIISNDGENDIAIWTDIAHETIGFSVISYVNVQNREAKGVEFQDIKGNMSWVQICSESLNRISEKAKETVGEIKYA